jgi:hypothetical protein
VLGDIKKNFQKKSLLRIFRNKNTGLPANPVILGNPMTISYILGLNQKQK